MISKQGSIDIQSKLSSALSNLNSSKKSEYGNEEEKESKENGSFS